MKKTGKKFSGFTLIELMVVITIIGILSGVAVVGLSAVRQRAQDTSYLANLRDMQISLEAYKSVNNTYPDALNALVPTFIKSSETNGATYSISSDKKSYCIYIRNLITKPEAQPDLYSAACKNSWVACKGTTAGISALNDSVCPGITSS